MLVGNLFDIPKSSIYGKCFHSFYSVELLGTFFWRNFLSLFSKKKLDFFLQKIKKHMKTLKKFKITKYRGKWWVLSDICINFHNLNLKNKDFGS